MTRNISPSKQTSRRHPLARPAGTWNYILTRKISRQSAHRTKIGTATILFGPEFAIGNIISGSKQLCAVEQECYGAIVDAGDLHVFAEDALFDGYALL